MHTRAKQTQENDHWRVYKNQKAILNKNINKQKQEYIKRN